MIVTADTLGLIARKPVNDNMHSTIVGLMLRPQILANRLQLAMAMGQVALESGGWTWDRELWGKKPTTAQARYDIRQDLGNTPERDGDGFLFRGRTGQQLTGRAAYRGFTAWAKSNWGAAAPDFEAEPDKTLTDPWEGLALPFFWEWKNLKPIADRADVPALTKRVNGGQNGLAERIAYTDRALQILADAADLKVWQTMMGLKPDGIIGPLTRGALVLTIRRLPEVEFLA